MKRKALIMRWNDWAAVVSVGAIIALFDWLVILAVVSLLDVAGAAIAFHPLGWPLWVSVGVGAVGSICLLAFDRAVMELD